MKRKLYNCICLWCFVIFTLCACGKQGNANDSDSSVLAIPENIISIKVDGFYNGGQLEPWELTQTEIEELSTWINQLSLKHRVYAEGETPNMIWNGGTSYGFNINDGELSFSWVYLDKTYILYDGEWYEITNTSNPPLNLDA